MRRKLLATLPLLLALLGSAAASAQTAPAAPPAQTTPSTQPAPAGQAQQAADGAEAIRACYAEYLNDMLHGGDWYMVRYRWWRTDTRQIEIPLKAQRIDGRWRIVRITPIDGGNRYGD